MKRQSGLQEKNKLQFVRLLGIEYRYHKVILILDIVFVKLDVKFVV